jgi:hypothetical protein
MRKTIISILLLCLVFSFYGCEKKAAKVVPADKTAAEKKVKFLESRRKLSDPNFVKNATPQQMKQISEDLRQK